MMFLHLNRMSGTYCFDDSTWHWEVTRTSLLLGRYKATSINGVGTFEGNLKTDGTQLWCTDNKQQWAIVGNQPAAQQIIPFLKGEVP